jgi:septum formation inhibitor-activating ATPase MinD
MNKTPAIIIAGLGDLAADVSQSGVFPTVMSAGGVRELLALFAQMGQKVRPDDVVFVFADTLPEDVPNMPLSEVLRRLTSTGFHVIIVSVTARGADLSRQHPKAGLLPTPVRLNDLLYAVNTFGFALEPVHNTNPAGVGQAPVTRTTAPQQPAFPQQASTDDRPAAAPQGGWSRPAAETPPPGNSPQRSWNTAPDSAGPAARPAADERPAQASAPQAWQPVAAAPTTSQPPATYSPAAPAATGPVSRPDGGNSRPALIGGGGAPSSWGGSSATGHAPVQRAGAYPSAPAAASRRGWVITVAVSKGGTGKSSLSLNLGAFLGMRLRMLNKTVCVIDSNFQQADAGKYLDQFHPNINTIADNPALLTKERILEGLVHKVEYNLSVLLGPATPDDGNPININSLLYNEVLDLLRMHYDYIIIDTPVAEKHHEIFANFALPRADYIIVPVAPSFPTLHNADNWLRAAVVQPRHAGGAGKDPSQVGVLLNRAEDGIGCSVDDVRMTMASWNFLGSIPETKEWKLANNNNELVAPKNFAELNQAFATVLYAATGEAVLMSNIEAPERKGGLRNVLERFRGRS